MPTPPRTKREYLREYLRELVADKNRWSRPLTDEECALRFPGLVQFVTFRLADSTPASRRGEWEHLLTMEDLRAPHFIRRSHSHPICRPWFCSCNHTRSGW